MRWRPNRHAQQQWAAFGSKEILEGSDEERNYQLVWWSRSSRLGVDFIGVYARPLGDPDEVREAIIAEEIAGADASSRFSWIRDHFEEFLMEEVL